MTRASIDAAQRLAPPHGCAARARGDRTRAPHSAGLSGQMASAGFYRMFVPRSIRRPRSVAGRSIARIRNARAADASCGWVAFIGATSGSVLARLPDDAAREIFSDSETLICGVFAPSGNAVICDGRLSR